MELPEGVTQLAMEAGSSDAIRYYPKNYNNVHDSRRIQLPPGTWQIICLSKDVTEEQAKEIVGRVPFTQLQTRKEALYSELRSKGLDPNNTLILKKQ